MNDLNHMVAVMQAWKEGKTIQSKLRAQGKDHWVDVAFPSWDWATFDYRVKPAEPRRLWMNLDPNRRLRSSICYDSHYLAVRMARNSSVKQAEFVEVVK